MKVLKGLFVAGLFIASIFILTGCGHWWRHGHCVSGYVQRPAATAPGAAAHFPHGG